MPLKKIFFIKNLILFMVPLLIPIVILGSFSISITQKFIRNDIDKSNIKILGQTKESVELIFNELDSLRINFELNSSIIIKVKDLLGANSGNYESLGTLDMVMNLINAPVNSKPYIQSIYIYYKNSKRNFFLSNQGIVNLNSYIDRSWYDSFVSNTDDLDTWIETRVCKQYSFENDGIRLITLYKKLYSPGAVKADGVLVMNIKRDYIDNILNRLVSYPNHSIIISGDNNTIVSETGNNPGINGIDLNKITSKPLNFFEFKSANNSYIVSQIKSDKYRLKYISIIPKSSLYKVPIQLTYITIVLLLMSFLLGMAITYYITKRNQKNINRIISTFISAENGEPLPELPSRVEDEYGFILQNIIKTFLEQSFLKVQLSEKRYKLKAIEMMALQSQINPHFLFNTLKTIFWKSIGLTGDQNEVSRMIEHLSGILHYSLGSPEKEVPLAEEIRNTQSYIEIQKTRYKDKFSVIWQYDDAITQYKVMKLMLQPFVENSIYHGIKEKEGSSYIKIKINLFNPTLRITIIDTGLGVDGETLEKIRRKLSEEEEYSEHIGLFNTNKRLKLMYGDDYGIEMKSKLGLGTVVYINIPIKKE